MLSIILKEDNTNISIILIDNFLFTENFDYVLNWLKIRKYSLALKYGLDNR